MNNTRTPKKTQARGKGSERDIELGIEDFSYGDLYDPEGLRRLHNVFLDFIRIRDESLQSRFVGYLGKGKLDGGTESDLLIAVAPYLSDFLGNLFGVQKELTKLDQTYLKKEELFRFKNLVVKRDMLKLERLDRQVSLSKTRVERFTVYARSLDAPGQSGKEDPISEDRLARVAIAVYDRLHDYKKARGHPEVMDTTTKIWTGELHAAVKQKMPEMAGEIGDPAREQAFLERIYEDVLEYVYALYLEQKTRSKEKRWPSFTLPEKLDFDRLVALEKGAPGGFYGDSKNLRRRDGFKLTDRRMDRSHVMSEVDYCLYCHEKKKDSCSSGLFEKDGASLRKSPLNIDLTGCPLDQKISESHLLTSRGKPLAALSVIMIDNPMCPGTGHRICNECMRACVYQKQDPVNIPQIETRLLTDVLYLPYGVEIYGLLTRWNPLNRKRPYPLPYNGKNILVVGQGPAGYTLAHYLTNEGFGVVGIDGLKIEPLPEEVTGRDGGIPTPIKDYGAHYQETDERILMGFGGVSEYGITVRWDKNFLNLLYLTLSRKSLYRVYGGIRFGGTMDIEGAWEMGFDHIAMSTGAGKPTIIPMKNNMISGIRKASDFLMTLQLTGASKKDSLASLQFRLPAVVIGGGLTGVDTATELFAYYPVLVEKTLDRYEKLAEAGLTEKMEISLNACDREILNEYLEHGRAIRRERKRAREAGEEPNFIPLVRAWGGVTLIYRKSLADSPAYKLNYEEVEKAMEEGIQFMPCYSPLEAIPDENNAISALIIERQAIDHQSKWRRTGEYKTLPVRCLCIAAGTSPNTVYEKERPGTFKKDKWDYYFATYLAETNGSDVSLKAGDGFFTSYQRDGKTISIYGDNHPRFVGNVTKAMASAKQGYPHLVNLFHKEIEKLDPRKQVDRDRKWEKWTSHLDEQFNAQVVEVKRLTSTIVEVIIRAPLAAAHFQPGQFYRIQRYETFSPIVEGTRLGTEGMALTGAWVDRVRGLLSIIILEMGHSSRLCANFKPGEKLVCMGPTGEPTVIPEGETILLVGGGLGNAVLFSIAEACKKRGNRVIYFAGYKNVKDIFKLEELIRSTDVLVLCADEGTPPQTGRPQDRIFQGNIVQAMAAYGSGQLGEVKAKLQEVNRLIVIGSDRMMAAVKGARCHQLKGLLPEGHIAFGSINSPMQCMMKEICAQCIQKHIDPQTGKEEYVFSCFNQDQHLDRVDFSNLNTRLSSNNTLEKLSNTWLDYCFNRHKEIKRI